MHGLNCHLLSCKFSGVPGSLTQWSPGPLAFTHRHGQSDGVHWPYLLCIRGRKTLSLVRFSGFNAIFGVLDNIWYFGGFCGNIGHFWPLLIVMVNLTACIGLIYFVFEDEKTLSLVRFVGF